MCCSIAFKATGLEPLFQTLGLDTDAQSVGCAVTWLKHQGADTVANLNQLPPGSYTCTDLADRLSMPMLKAHAAPAVGPRRHEILCNPPQGAPISRQPFARQVLSSRTRPSLLRQ